VERMEGVFPVRQSRQAVIFQAAFGTDTERRYNR
jgi:hypothetical protein